MAQEALSGTLDSSDRSRSPSSDSDARVLTPSTSSDPSLSRSSSFTRLNAQAPEFVPSPRPQQPDRPDLTQTQRMAVPPPPPPGMLHVPFQHPMVNQHQFHPYHMPVQYHNPHHHQHHQNHNQHHHYHHHLKQHHKNQAQFEHDHAAQSKNGLSDEAIPKILNQVEYYFSDINLATTDHLMRFINKDPEGYVPISVVASFKKIKALISSNCQLASVLRNSSKLVVSEDGKRVRRLHPLTESDMEELQSRVVVAENLPEDHCHQNLMKIFSFVGSVKAIRTCQPQTSNGGGALASRSSKGDVMLYGNKLHAFVEYESVELAEKAVEELNDESDWRSGLRVRLLHKRGSKHVQAWGKKGHNGGHAEEHDALASEQQLCEKPLDNSIEQPDGLHGQSGEENANEKEGGQRKGWGRGQGRGRGRGQYHHHNNRGETSTAAAGNPGMGEAPTVAKQQPPGPRMPDGTRGFAMGRGKPVAVNTM